MGATQGPGVRKEALRCPCGRGRRLGAIAARVVFQLDFCPRQPRTERQEPDGIPRTVHTVVILVVVAVVSFTAGAVAAARWLPELAEGPVGSFVFFVVCGLLGASVALISISIDTTIRNLEERGSPGDIRVFIVSNGLTVILRDAGTLAALALIAYLLAPKPAAVEPGQSAGL